MRDLNDNEIHALNKLHICPNCGSDQFLSGPRGGLCQNIECASCGARYNIPLVPFNFDFGQLIHEPANYMQRFGFRDPEPVRMWNAFKDRLVASIASRRWGLFRRGS